VWKEAGLKPHRIEHYLASDDPDFESKAADIIDLYLNPPQHAAVFCADEKTAIQALDRLDPELPLRRAAPNVTGLIETWFSKVERDASGNIPIRPAASAVTLSLRQATSQREMTPESRCQHSTSDSGWICPGQWRWHTPSEMRLEPV
jgi:hypothetical protein